MARDLKGVDKHLSAKRPGRKAMDGRERKAYTVHLPIEIVDEIDELIARKDKKSTYPTRSDFVTVALEEKFKNESGE